MKKQSVTSTRNDAMHSLIPLGAASGSFYVEKYHRFFLTIPFHSSNFGNSTWLGFLDRSMPTRHFLKPQKP
jgi:hypothetical protein